MPSRGSTDPAELVTYAAKRNITLQIFECWMGVTPEEEVFQKAVAEVLGE